MEEQAKYADSIQGRVNSLTAMWQEFSNTVLSSNAVKGFVSVLTEVLKVIEQIIDAIGGLGTLSIAGGLFGIGKMMGIGKIASEVLKSGNAFNTLGDAASAASQKVGGAWKELKGNPLKSFATGATVAVAALSVFMGWYDSMQKKIEETRQENIDLSNSFNESFSGFEQAYIKYSGKTLLTAEEESELASAIDGTITALGDKSGALRDAAGASSEYAANLEKIAKVESEQSRTLSMQAMSDAKARFDDNTIGDNAGQLSWANSFGNVLYNLPIVEAVRGWMTGTSFTKYSNADFALGDKADKAYKAVEKYIDKGRELGYIAKDLSDMTGMLGTDDEGFVFDHFDSDFDNYINQVKYVQGLVDELNTAAAESGDKSLLDSDLYKNAKDSLSQLQPNMEEYIAQTYNAEKANYQLNNGIAKNVDEFNKMRDAVLKSSSDSIEGRSAIGSLMNTEYQNTFDLSSLESQMSYIKSVTDGIADISSTDMGKFETVLDLKTNVNGSSGTVGDYVDTIESANDAISKIADENAQEFLRVQLGIEVDDAGNIDDEIIHMKDKVIDAMKKSGIDEEVADEFTDSLTAAELNAVVEGQIEVDWDNFNAEEVRKQIADHVKMNEAISFEVDIEAQVENLDNINSAISKSVSGKGLDTEAYENIERIFANVNGYDPSKLFERTANGIRLNTDELRSLNSEMERENVAGLENKMSALGDQYNKVRSELSDLAYGTDEYNSKLSELNGIEAEIQSAEALMAQYEGLTSAYNEWQMAESAGNQRDMYESVLNGFKTVEDELSRGWVDEGTIQFVEMLSGKDLTSGNVDEIRSAWEGLGKTIEHTTYSAKDFFTVNKDGQSTSDGVYNFLDAVGQLEEEAFGGKDVVQRNGDGNIIGFDFQLAGGDEAIAEALGVSEELVQIMVRAADDAGFVVSMDGTFQQLDVLKEKAAEAALSLKETFKITDHSFFQDGSADGILNDYNEAVKIWDSFKQNKNADGTINMNVEGAEEAFTLVSTLQTMVDQLNEPAYMSINASDVEKDMQQPLSQLQQYERLTQTEHQLKLKGTDTSQIEASKEEVLDYFEGLEPEVKAQLGIDELSREQLQEKIEAGEIEVPATVDLQVEMNDTLKDMVNVALYNAGVINDKELESRVDVSVYANDVDASDVKEKTDKAVSDASKDKKKTESTTDVDVKAGKVDASDVKDKTKEAVDNVKKEHDNIEKSVDLEVKIDEYNKLIENLEDADKDIKINVSVDGLNQVKELNKNIDLATKIDGDIDNLSEFVDAAKKLNGVDDNIVKTVTANLNGNLDWNGNLDDLDKFADGAKKLEGVDSSYVTVTAKLDANVGGILGYNDDLENLDKFADGAKKLSGIENSDVSVKANLDANIGGILGYNADLDNLDKFADAAKKLSGVDGSSVEVDATLNANVGGILGYNADLDNLDRFTDAAKKLENVNSSNVTVDATLNANVGGILGYNDDLENLNKFADGAKKLENIESSDVVVTAKLDANTGGFLGANPDLDNLDKFADAAEKLENIKSSDVTVSATLNANTGGFLGINPDLDNLDKFADAAKTLDGVNGSDVTVSATLNADIDKHAADNLGAFADGAKKLQGVGDASVTVTANLEGKGVGGDIFGNNSTLDNLNKFASAAKSMKDVGDASATITANLRGEGVGNDIFGSNSALDNLNKFADSANKLKNVGDASVTVTANLEGSGVGNNIFGSNSTLDNLNKFAEGAKKLNGIGDVSASVTANLYGNIGNGITGSNSKIDNLKSFAEGSKALNGVNSKTVNIEAYLKGNLGSSGDAIGNLPAFAATARDLQAVNSKDVTVTAYIYGNLGDDNNVANLSEFKTVASNLPSSSTVTVNANVDTDGINNAKASLKALSDSGVMHDYSANVNVAAKVSSVDDSAVQNYQVPPKDGKVKYTVDSSQVDAWTAPPKTGTVNYSAHVDPLTDSQKYKTGTIVYKARVEGAPSVNGTAHANGTVGKAFSHGNWETEDSGTALMGELGQETIVRDGHFFTVGDNGAEFVKYRKGDIIFNHKQTEELFKNGYVTSGGGRGKAYVDGTAFARGSSGSGGWGRPGTGSYNYNVSSGNSKSTKSSKSSKSSDSKASEEAEKFEEVLDWIAIAIDRIEREIKNLDTVASSTFRGWSERTEALNEQIAQTRNEIDLQQRAYDRYMKAANDVGLDAGWAQKVRDGKVDVELITDENVADKVKQYQEWYNKALDARDAVIELTEAESQLFQQRFDNVSEKFDGYLGVIEHEKNMLDEFISQSEAKGYITSQKYYEALSKNTNDRISELKKQRDEMTAEMNAAVDSGAIEKYSQSWYEMVNAIDDVTLEIESANTELLEFKKTMRELDWEVFELIQDRISGITEESDFLIDLMSNKKLYDDKGQLTDEGQASMGLHGVNYNTYMNQADQYAKKVAELNAQIAKDPYNQDLINKRDEYLEAQRESILNAEDEKDAIKSLVEDAINAELDALDKLIDKRNEALSNAKD